LTNTLNTVPLLRRYKKMSFPRGKYEKGKEKNKTIKKRRKIIDK
jgi:hypothetical protein